MKTRMMGGAGGYGGISTMNQDQRGPRYAPHRNISLFQNYTNDRTEVSCRDCGQQWYHPRGDRKDTPLSCSRVVAVIAAETVLEPYVTERNEVAYRPRGESQSEVRQNVVSSGGQEGTSG